jgi:hypothetical protein
MIGFLTIPEKSYNDSRCAKTCPINHSIYLNESCTENIKKNYDLFSELHFKQSGVEGENCNLINLCLMIFINEIEPQYLSNMIQNLDNINVEQLFENRNTYESINREILDIMDERSNSPNILNRIVVNKLLSKKVTNKIIKFIIENGLFGPCRYVIPISL